MKTLAVLFTVGLVSLATFVNGQTTKTVGATGADYATLKLAFDDINAGTVAGAITLQLIDNTAETSSAILNASGTGSANYTSVVIYPTVSGITITGSIVAPLIDLNGADIVTIDGRVNAIGTSKDLTITNTNTGASASTIRFINTAENNTVKYCTVKGSSTNNSGGVIFFSTAADGSGNDGNTIDNCNITCNATSRPVNAIYSAGTVSMENSENTISNNNIYDFLNPATPSIGISLSANTTAWTISGNSFYETTSFVPSGSGSYSVIQVNNTLGADFTVSNNHIGGSAPQCTGTAWTKTNAGNNMFKAINVNVRNSSINNIQNNTVKNFNWSNSGNASWTGISVAFGSVNIGTETGNTIGEPTGTGSITVTGGTSGQAFYGIDVAGNGTIVCSNNTIGSVTVANANSAYASNFYGINRTNTVTNTFSNNTIGSTSQSNSIYASSASTANAQSVYGINNTTGGTVILNSNTIANLTNGTTNSTIDTPGLINGIASSAATNSIINNNISDLTISNANTSSSNTASICGIVLAGSNANKTVTGNTIAKLSNTSALFAGSVIGLYFGTTNSTHIVSSNFIYDLSVTGASSTAAEVYGIKASAGITTYSNNIISLGGNTATTIYGIYESGASTQTCRLYFNTIYIEGNLSSGATNKSYALYSAASANTRDYRNNILNNERSTTNGSNLHYAAYFNYAVSTLLTLGFNDYYAPGTGGVLGYYNGADVTSLPLIAGLDAYSLAVSPAFTSPGSTTATDYKPTSVLLAGTTISTVPTDYSLTNRAGTPTMGAFEGTLSLNVDVYKSGIFQSTYPLLRDAFNKINNGTHTGALEVRIKASSTETASAVIYQSGYTGAGGTSNYSSITIYPVVAGVIMSGSFDAPIIDLNGADNVIIDGRVNAAGATNDLTIVNANISSFASAVRFINSAENNTVKHCNINSSCYSVGVGVINFTGSASGNGNDNNIIEYCNITNAGGNRPINLIFSSGATGRENSGNIIRNNNIFNFINAGATSYGIILSNSTTGWTISGNSFYDTETIAPTGSFKYYPLFINTGTHTISNNYVGGSAPLCNGSPWTVNSSIPHYFCGVFINGTTTNASTVENNTIKNISYTSTEDNPWDGIFINSGIINVTGNTIGATEGQGSITVTTPVASASAVISGGVVTEVILIGGGMGYTTAPLITFSVSGSTSPAIATSNITDGVVTGINLISGGSGYTAAPNVIFDGQSTAYSTSHGMIKASSATVTITGNNIGSITTVGSDTYSHGFESIYVRGVAGQVTISNNLIGSLVTSKSINTSSTASLSLQKQDCYGIYSTGTGSTTISENTIANLHNAYTGTLSASRVRGIQTTAGSNMVQKNTVRNISSASGQSSFGSSASVIGITQTGNTAGTTQTITGNTVYDLSNTNVSATVYITGIYYAGPASGTNTITGNFIHSLSLISSDINSEMNGISLYGGLTTTASNIISLGGPTVGYRINGIRDESGATNNNNIYFNSVYIGGNVSSGITSTTTALWNSANTSTRNYRNNILSNARTGGTAGKHLAVRIDGIANTTIDYNDYYSASGTLGRIASLDKVDLAAWQASTGQDLHSLSINPGFTLAGGTSALNYYTSASLPGVAGTGIATDYAGLSRGVTPKMGALESNDYTWQGATSTDFGTASNWTGGTVPPDGADITFAVNPDRNCVLDINRTVGNITNAQTTYKLDVNGKQLTVNGSLIFSNGAQIDASNSSSTVAFAGSIAQNIPSGAFVSNTIASLTINNVNGLTLNGDLTINEGIALIDGNFAIGPNTLTFNGIVTAMTGTVTGGSSTNMIIGGTGASINMPSFLLNNLIINRESGVSLYGDLSIAGTLTLTAGTLTVGANTLTISGSSPVRTSGLIDAGNPSATIIFTNTTAITLPASIFAGAVNHLTINNAGGITASSDFTVNGVLNLPFVNPSAIKGLLDMGENTLSMGAAATTTGVGDVTGIVRRTSFVANTVYTFGNPFTTVTFPNTGTLPTEFSFKIKTGTAPAWKPGAIQRTYDIIRTGGTGSLPTVKLHYLDTELNGNTEADLVFFGYLASNASVTEFGKVNGDINDNWVSLSGSIEFAPEAFGLREWTLSNSMLSGFTWLGAVPGQETDWDANMNWSGGIVPTSSSDVVIPAGCAYYPTLPSGTTINSISIESGATLNGGTSTSLTINGGNSAWYNRGTFNPQTSTVIFTNAFATMSGSTDFYNITINPGAGVTLTTDNIMRIAGSIVNGGSLDATEFPNTVEYNDENQIVIYPNGATAGYYHLILSGTGTKTLPATSFSVFGDFTTSGAAIAVAEADMIIAGNVTIGEGSTFVTGNYNHSIGGNFENNGTFTASAGGTVTMNGSSAQSMIGAVTTSFNDLTINNSQGVSLLNDVNIGNVLTLTSGNLILGETTLGINGTVSRTAGFIEISPLSSLSFGGADALTITNDLFTTAPSLNNLTINRTGGVTLGNQSMTVNGVLDLSSGTLSLAANTLTIAGNSPTRTSGTIDASNAVATLAFTNTSAITLPASVFSAAVNNLTINGTGGVTAVSDFTVNGVLNLQAVNPSAFKGSLDMLDGSAIRTLTMGADATTTGPGDVTGIVRRTFFAANVAYTYGSQFTTITMGSIGTLPSQIQAKISIGTSPAWKTSAINRIYDIIQTGGINCRATITTHYSDNELNGNIENTLVLWGFGTEPPFIGLFEFGRSNSNSADNWVSIANVPMSVFPSDFGEYQISLANSELALYTWNGSQSSSWITTGNWTPSGIPSSLHKVIIPDASTTLNSPTLPASTEINSLQIDAAGILNSISGAQLTINGSNNAWSNAGGTFNAGSGNVIFTNAAATMSGTTNFFNVTLNTGSGLTVVPGSGLLITSGGTIAIPSGASLTIDAGAALTVNGTITNNGTLNLLDGITSSATTTIEGDGSYFVGGNWVNNGTFLPGASTVTFNGSGVQTISGTSLTTFNNLIIDGTSAGTTIAAGARVTVSGSTFNTNGKLIINSDATNNGSLIYSGSGTPSGNITYNRQMPSDALYHYISSPVSSGLLPATGTLWAWDEPSGTWEDNVTYCASGIGYTARTNGSLVSFTGSLVAGIDIVATSPYYSVYVDGTLADYNARWASGRTNYGGGGWNLLGNPFTSAMQIGGEAGFLNANDGDGSLATNKFDPNYVAVYIYDGDSYYYRGKDINFPDPVVNEDPANQMYGFDNTQAGQGFFVLAMQNGVSFHFDRSMQTHEPATTMLKSAATQAAWPGLQLKVKYGEKESSTIIVYNENMTTGLDPGYDVGQLSAGPDVEIYTSMVSKDNNVNFARQALPLADCDKIIIPVGIDSENGGTVTFSAFVVPLDNYRFWLEDRTTGIFTDLNFNSSTVSLPAKTYGTGRFFIHASANIPTDIDSPADDHSQDLRIWNADDKVIIKGNVSERAICEVYDMRGQKVLISRLTEGELNIVDLVSISQGVFLVRVVDGMEVYTRKIVLL